MNNLGITSAYYQTLSINATRRLYLYNTYYYALAAYLNWVTWKEK